MITKITFDKLVKPNATFSVRLETRRVWFFDELEVGIGEQEKH